MSLIWRCVLLASILLSAASIDFHGSGTKRAEPLMRHKMVDCFDENVKIRDPKNYEVEKRRQNEETRMSIIRHKRRARCIVKMSVSDGHVPRSDPRNFEMKTSYEINTEVTSPPIVHSYNKHSSHSVTSPPVLHTYNSHSSHSATSPPIVHSYNKHSSHSVTSPPIVHSYNKHSSHSVTSPPIEHSYNKHSSHSVTSPPIEHSYNKHSSHSVTSPPVLHTYNSHSSHSVTSPPVVRTYNRHSSHTVTSGPITHTYHHSVTSPPIVVTYSNHHSHSSDHEDRDNSYAQLPGIPDLPDIPHIGHEGTYVNQNVHVHGNHLNNGQDISDDVDPQPGEKTITFKTNTNRHETVDHTGFVKEKANGYPHRINDEWIKKFSMMDGNGRFMNSGYSVSGKLYDRGILLSTVMLQCYFMIVA